MTSRILIVDDDRDNRDLLELILSREGFVILTATDGEEALATSSHQSPDLILLDVMMPGMTGYEVAARLKSDPVTNRIPIIMVTALDDSKTRALALDAGAADVFAKPVSSSELCARVRKLLGAQVT